MESFHCGLEKMCRMPRKSPSPSSPTLATKTIGKEWVRRQACMAAAVASNAVRPEPLSEIPGPSNLPASRRISIAVPAGNTVSM